MRKPSTVTLSKMRDRSSFCNAPTLRKFLAEQLRRKRLSLALGAGASMGFDLPNWEELVNRCFDNLGESRPAGSSCESAADTLLYDHCGNDDIKFAELVRAALYATADISLESLQRNELLSAVGALTMASSRGNVAQVLSFNFDDILELFLNYHGFKSQSIETMPAWSEANDVTVYHPHGLLPSGTKKSVNEPIVFAQIHYDKKVGQAGDLWRSMMLNVLRSSTCLFIGLSGNDSNLRSVLTDVMNSHASTAVGDAFWGVRLCRSDDPNQSLWEMRGVFNHVLDDYKEIPGFLFSICQEAANMS